MGFWAPTETTVMMIIITIIMTIIIRHTNIKKITLYNYGKMSLNKAG